MSVREEGLKKIFLAPYLQNFNKEETRSHLNAKECLSLSHPCFKLDERWADVCNFL